MIIHLLGFPGVGKYTVARALSARAEARGHRIVVVDNHQTSNAILSVIDADGVRELPAGVWDRVGEIREAVYQAIEDLSPPDWSFVFTNVVVKSDPEGVEVIERLRRLALARATGYFPVTLHCATEELLRRVPAAARAERMKWIDPAGVKAFVATEELLRPESEILDLDVTDLAPNDSASQIEDYLGLTPR